ICILQGIGIFHGLSLCCSCKPSIGLRCDLANTDQCEKKLREPSCLSLTKTQGRICALTNSLNPRSGLGRNYLHHVLWRARAEKLTGSRVAAPRKRGRNAVLAMSLGEIYAERRRGMRSTIAHAPNPISSESCFTNVSKRQESVANSFKVS